MNDLPPFLQMFIRLFATLALGVWLQLLAAREPEKKAEKEHERTEQHQAQAPAQSQQKADDTAKPACPSEDPAQK